MKSKSQSKTFTLTPKFGVTLRSKGGFTLIELPSLRPRLRRAQAFTLIELLVVIGLLASFRPGFLSQNLV